MTRDPIHPPRALRLWPGALLLAMTLGVRFGVPWIAPQQGGVAMLGGLLGALLVGAWWVFFSGAPRAERFGGALLAVVALIAVRPLLDPSLARAGQGALYFIYAAPILALACVLWAAASRGLGTGARWVTLLAALVASTGGWTLLRTGGLRGSAGADLSWRWTPTPEELLLAQGGGEPGPAPARLPEPPQAAADATREAPPEWPGFRGAERNGVVAGPPLSTDWSEAGPEELWRRPIGPGWSSFAVDGDRLYTQEQRGEDELVACYHAATGEPLWWHRDGVRFWESNAGAGPRATPTLDGGCVYAVGGTGIVNALDAIDGSPIWSRDLSEDAGTPVPEWGFSSSPEVHGELVYVAAAGRCVAYDRATGEPRWMGPLGSGYSSPQLFELGGVDQLLLLSDGGLSAFEPAQGGLLWSHEWTGAPIVQPLQLGPGDLLISTAGPTGALGLRRVSVREDGGAWTVDERWTTNRLKPYFSDFVVHGGHAYGFDASILACIELEGGQRQWKGGRYGHGQLLLLAPQELLLLITEEGELVLVEASPTEHRELARARALEGKTWNHPVLVAERLFVRNGQEMAAFRLPTLSK